MTNKLSLSRLAQAASLSVLSAVLLAGCSENGLRWWGGNNEEPVPIIEVEPASLTWADQSADESVVQSFLVRNIGAARLEVEDIVVGGETPTAFTILADELAFGLQPEEEREIEVAFQPVEPEGQTGQISVLSTDPVTPEAFVDLSGMGRVPRLAISPDPWDFGSRNVPCPDDVELVLQNVGNETLTITELAYDSPDGSMTLRDGYTLPLVLEPKDFTSVMVDWVPLSDTPVTGTLSAISNDPNGVVAAKQTGTGISGAEASDTFTAPTDPPIDLLFLVDQSCSMDDDSASLAANFSSFIGAINSVTAGWQIGVVTYDHGCFNSGILKPTTSNLESTFATAVTLGNDSEVTMDEKLLQLADRALYQTSSSGCNKGFLRAGALLHLIIVSDEPERSTETAAAWTWDYWVKRMEGYVSDPGLLKISGVLDTDGCSEGDKGYSEAIAYTGGEKLSICAGDWADYVATLAAASLTHTYTFELTEIAVPSTVRVTVNGAPSSDWSFDVSLNAVVFDRLDPGSVVEVTYATGGGCP
jgi:hypothetical protein